MNASSNITLPLILRALVSRLFPRRAPVVLGLDLLSPGLTPEQFLGGPPQHHPIRDLVLHFGFLVYLMRNLWIGLLGPTAPEDSE